jgi:hypothetical protein
MKLLKWSWLGVFALVFVAIACQKDVGSPSEISAAKGGKSTPTTQYDPLTVACGDVTQGSIELKITAGGTGARSGFSVQWMTKEDFDNYTGLTEAGGWPRDETAFCKASFSGNAFSSRYNLTANAFVLITIGDVLLDNGASVKGSGCSDELLCDTRYVFRVFAHGDNERNRSEYTIWDNDCSTTEECGSTSTCGNRKGYGWWKNYFTEQSIYTDLEDANVKDFMALGDVWYSANEINAILNYVAPGNGYVNLAHQLITAKLNGVSTTASASADAAFNGIVVPPTAGSTTTIQPSSLAGLVQQLHRQNNSCRFDN